MIKDECEMFGCDGAGYVEIDTYSEHAHPTDKTMPKVTKHRRITVCGRHYSVLGRQYQRVS